MSDYADKLLDPRWQKKRLKIFERDDWTCQECRETIKTLHIHHDKYTTKDPWDEPDENLVTVCLSCHEKIEEDKLDNCFDSELNKIIRKMKRLFNKLENYKDCNERNNILKKLFILDLEKQQIERGYIIGQQLGFYDGSKNEEVPF